MGTGPAERQPGSLPAGGPRPNVTRVARKHEAVDDKRVLAGREQLREHYVGLRAVRAGPLEDVVLRHDPARRKLTSGCSDGLRGATELDLLVEQPVARRAVLR